MTTTLSLRELSSRIVRERLTQGSSIEGFREIIDDIRSDAGGAGTFIDKVKSIFGKGLKLVGLIAGKILGGIGFTFVSLWGLIVQTSSFIYNFDWNIRDEQIDQRFEILKQVMAGQLGETAGNAFGYLACGILPSAAIFAYNEPLGYYLLQEVGEEAFDEFCDNFGAMLQIGFRSLATGLAYKTFKNFRKAVKVYVSRDQPRLRSMTQKIFGNNIVQAIESWGTAESTPWSFSLAVEERIENIQNPITQEFVEEFYEEFLDSCVEAGYVVAQSLDNWVALQREEDREEEEEEEIIEILPDRDNPDESIILNGRIDEIRCQALNGLNNYNLIESRDVGAWVGEPLRDSLRRPHKDIVLKILLRSALRPPFKNSDGSNAKRVQIEIPNVDKSKIDWKDIKQAVGGTSGYMWGNHFVNARLEDNNFIRFYAESEAEGRRVLERLLKLTKSELLTLSIHEEKREGARRRYDALFKERTRVYPSHVVIINQIQLLRQDTGQATVRGHIDHRQIKIPLYQISKPDNFQELVNSLFLIPQNS